VRAITKDNIMVDIECRLSTGLKDIEGKEIFDGDVIGDFRVVFRNGAFFLHDTKHPWVFIRLNEELILAFNLKK